MPRQPVAGPSRIKASSTQAPPPPPSVSCFNPDGTLYACAQPVLGSADKISVWDVHSDRLLAEWELDSASKATTVNWAFTSSPGHSKKKRRKSEPRQDDREEVVIVTSADSLVAFSPKRGEVVRRLEVGAVSAAYASDRGVVLSTSKEVLCLSSDLSSITTRVSLPQGIPPITSIAALPTSTNSILHILLGATSSIITIHLDPHTGKIAYTSNPFPVSTTSVTALYPLPIDGKDASFLVLSQDDRTVSQYTASTPTSPVKLSYRYASPTLSSAHSVSLCPTRISVLHQSGEVSIFPIPTELDLSRPKSDSKPSTFRVVEGKEDRVARLCGTVFDDDALRCGCMTGGRVKWVRGVFELPEGGLRPETVIKKSAQDLVGANVTETTTQRYTAPAPMEIPVENSAETSTLPADVDMADLTLGERLLAQPQDAPEKPSGPTNAASLTRLLVQALHTSDPALLTLVLSHRDPILIRNTIRKMPPQLALPLLKVCVERLGQGKGINKRGGGRGVAANEQQGRGVVNWIKGVLVERGSLLMTMPSLPSQLAQLSSLLQQRAALYQPLLSLSGRLDLALAQIEMRRLAAATISEGKTEGYHYVEGESEDESDDEDGVRVEVGDGEGEIEDIDMRANGVDDGISDDDESEEDPLESGSDDGLDLDDDEEINDDSDGSAEDEED